MSYFENISSLIDNEVSSLLKNISIKYSLDEEDVIEMWRTQKSNNTSEKKQTALPSPGLIVDNQLMKLGRNELVEMCKVKRLKVGGTKNDLVSRIQQYETNKTNNVFKTENEKSSQAKGNGPVSNVVINKLVEKIPVIEIKKNKFGNYEYFDELGKTHLVFDNKTQKIYGKQNIDGTISKLTKEDINTCNQYKFSYVLPDNLDEDDDEEIEYEEVVEVDDEQVDDEEDDEEEEEEEEEEIEIELDEEYE